MPLFERAPATMTNEPFGMVFAWNMREGATRDFVIDDGHLTRAGQGGSQTALPRERSPESHFAPPSQLRAPAVSGGRLTPSGALSEIARRRDPKKNSTFRSVPCALVMVERAPIDPALVFRAPRDPAPERSVHILKPATSFNAKTSLWR